MFHADKLFELAIVSGGKYMFLTPQELHNLHTCSQPPADSTNNDKLYMVSSSSRFYNIDTNAHVQCYTSFTVMPGIIICIQFHNLEFCK